MCPRLRKPLWGGHSYPPRPPRLEDCEALECCREAAALARSGASIVGELSGTVRRRLVPLDGAPRPIKAAASRQQSKGPAAHQKWIFMLMGAPQSQEELLREQNHKIKWLYNWERSFIRGTGSPLRIAHFELRIEYRPWGIDLPNQINAQFPLRIAHFELRIQYRPWGIDLPNQINAQFPMRSAQCTAFNARRVSLPFPLWLRRRRWVFWRSTSP